MHGVVSIWFAKLLIMIVIVFCNCPHCMQISHETSSWDFLISLFEVFFNVISQKLQICNCFHCMQISHEMSSWDFFISLIETFYMYLCILSRIANCNCYHWMQLSHETISSSYSLFNWISFQIVTSSCSTPKHWSCWPSFFRHFLLCIKFILLDVECFSLSY